MKPTKLLAVLLAATTLTALSGASQAAVITPSGTAVLIAGLADADPVTPVKVKRWWQIDGTVGDDGDDADDEDNDEEGDDDDRDSDDDDDSDGDDGDDGDSDGGDDHDSGGGADGHDGADGNDD